MINTFFRGCVVLAVFVVLGGCSAVPESGGRVLSFDTQVYVGDVPLKVVVFDTPEERELGLMHVEELPEGTGALFVYPQETGVAFWMKNTQFPMDMLFFDQDKCLVHFVESMQPCNADSCLPVKVAGVKYVVEQMVVNRLDHDSIKTDLCNLKLKY